MGQDFVVLVLEQIRGGLWLGDIAFWTGLTVLLQPFEIGPDRLGRHRARFRRGG
jgi:hypothetical protein